jgi:hypothetical protein
VSGMSESVYETPVNEIMDRLMKAVMDGWIKDKQNVHITPWGYAVWTINTLKYWEKWNEDDESIDSVVDLLAFFARDASGDLAMSKEEFMQLWSKLTDEQKEAFLKELYHNMALYGLRALFYHEGGKVKLNEVKEYLSGIITFRELMERLIKKYSAVSFEAGDELFVYVNEDELRNLVRKYLLPQLIKHK